MCRCLPLVQNPPKARTDVGTRGRKSGILSYKPGCPLGAAATVNAVGTHIMNSVTHQPLLGDVQGNAVVVDD